MVLKFLCLLVSFASFAAETPKVVRRVLWERGGLDNPRAAYFDVTENALFVANAGFLSRLDGDGNVVDPRWASGLKNPAGMRSFDGILYVADGSGIARFHARSGRAETPLSVPGAGNLTDISIARDGTLYAADPETKKIFMLRAKEARVLWAMTESPAALFLVHETLYVATREGSLFSKNLITQEEKRLAKKSFGKAVGLERGSDLSFFFTNGKELYSWRRGGRKLEFLAESAIGRIAYVYKAEPSEDYLVLPLPESKKVLALRVGLKH